MITARRHAGRSSSDTNLSLVVLLAAAYVSISPICRHSSARCSRPRSAAEFLLPASGRVAYLFNDEALGSDKTYQTYTAAFRSYHSLTPSLVLAWEVEGCKKAGSVALWDACRMGLRGFPATDYMAKASASAQLEARWRFHPRWGAVAFGGAVTVAKALAGSQDDELVPSIGVGLRFMVLPAKRINLRLDYGRSDGGEAIYFSVGEAF